MVRRSNLRRIVLACLAASVLLAGWFLAAVIWFRPPSINLFFERAFYRSVLRHPEWLSYLRILEPYGLDFYNDDLTDASDEFDRHQLELARHELRVLRSYDRTRLTAAQRLSADIADWSLDDKVRGEPFLYHNYPVNQLEGMQSELPTFMAKIHQIDNKHDAENYIKRLSKFGVKFDQVLDNLKTREARGIILPTFLIDKTLEQMRAFVGQDPRANILYISFEEKLGKLNGVSDTEKQALCRAVEQQITMTVYPAYRELIAYFEALRPRSTTDAGVWKFPDGDAFYAHVLRSQTTTDMTPEQVHELGLKEVARIEGEMRALLDVLGCSGKTVSECARQLRSDPQHLYPNEDASRPVVLADLQKILDDADHNLSGVFDIRPKMGVKVERMPAFKEKTSPDAYYDAPSLDGARPGIFYANLYEPGRIYKCEMKTLAYHEAIPGHHFQIAVQQELRGVPTFRKVEHFTAYVEGWGLYAEQLAAECGFYKDDPCGDFGRLSWEQFRASRLVVDTGIHYKRWTREQAMAYMDEHVGDPSEVEIDRYIVDPGQACAYKIGQLKILELREKARAELGPRFNIKEFHNVVLQNGAVPLAVLDRLVEDYIASKPNR